MAAPRAAGPARAAAQGSSRGLDQQLERLTEAYLLGVVPLPEYQRRRGVEDRLQALHAQAEQLEAQADRRAHLAGWAASAVEFCQRAQGGLAEADFAQRRQLMEPLVDRVVVTDDEVEIRYVVPLSPEGERGRFCHLRKDYLDGVAPAVEIRIEASRAALSHVPFLTVWDHGPDAAPVWMREDRPVAADLVTRQMPGTGAGSPRGPRERPDQVLSDGCCNAGNGWLLSCRASPEWRSALRRHELSDAQWELIADPMPRGGGRWGDHRQVMNGLMSKLAINFAGMVKLAFLRRYLRSLSPSEKS